VNNRLARGVAKLLPQFPAQAAPEESRRGRQPGNIEWRCQEAVFAEMRFNLVEIIAA
jgi:hypothetical protein